MNATVELESTLTVIAAMREEADAMLISADTGGRDSGLPIYDQRKLRRHPNGALAWGYAGNGQLGADFGQWFERQDIPSTWEALRDLLAGEIARLNGEARRLVSLSGVEPGENDVISILIAGWVGLDADIWVFDDRGLNTSYSTEGFYAIGGGGAFARVAYFALTAVRVDPPLAKFRVASRVAARLAPLSSLPCEVWRITPDGVQVIDAAPNSSDSGSPNEPKTDQ